MTPDKKGVLWAHAAMLSAGLIYGGSYVAAKEALMHVPALTIVQIRVTSGALVFGLWAHWLIKEKVRSKTDLLRLAACSLFGVSINMIFFFEGMTRTSTLNASLIMVIVPVIVMLFSRLILKEPMNLVKILGLSLGVSGALLLIITKDIPTQTSSNPVLGNLMILLNASSYGLYLVLLKPLMNKYHPLTVSRWLFLFSTLFCLPFCWQKMVRTPFHSFSQELWWMILYLAIGSTVITFFLNISSLKKVPPSMVGYYIYVQPLFANFIQILRGKEIPAIEDIISAFLIFSGVFLVGMQKQEPAQKPTKKYKIV